MKAIAVIGACWGDEGKGLLTDYFSDPHTIVIRYNGGAQAGHTVVRNGQRFVFHHFGSGTLSGAETFLSRYFINNPILFLSELEKLRHLGHSPKVIVDSMGLVTTPWDMMINQIVEESRGITRHGSCGVGINETVKRSEVPRYLLTINNLRQSEKHLERTLFKIKTEWVPERLRQLNLHPSDTWMSHLSSYDILETYMIKCKQFMNELTIIDAFESNSFISVFKNIVFEGAQGLLLDEDHYFFPHVTHSHTGLNNILDLCSMIHIDSLDVIYATRAYATRHGAGPFPREVEGLFYEDNTNVPNVFQGTLRFGHLDIDLLKETIENDLKKAETLGYMPHLRGHLPLRHGLAITCLDQVGEMVNFWEDGEKQYQPWKEMVNRAQQKIDAIPELNYVSFSPEAPHWFE